MSKHWTAAEDELLSELWGTVSIQAIAARLNRSESGIINRARRLDLGPFLMAGDYVSLNQLMIAWAMIVSVHIILQVGLKTAICLSIRKRGISVVFVWFILMSFGNGQKRTETL